MRAFVLRLACAYPKATRGLAGGVLAWVVLCVALGYRVPWFDRHPNWDYFPTLTNPRLVVEEIPDSVFAIRYGRRFPYPAEADTFMRTLEFYEGYHTNLKNVRSVGFQITNNDFDDDIYIDLYPGPNAVVSDERNPWRPGFNNFGYEYLELRLDAETGHFKAQQIATSTALEDFYQYNHPRAPKDTLFLRYGPANTNYRVYVR